MKPLTNPYEPPQESISNTLEAKLTLAESEVIHFKGRLTVADAFEADRIALKKISFFWVWIARLIYFAIILSIFSFFVIFFVVDLSSLIIWSLFPLALLGLPFLRAYFARLHHGKIANKLWQDRKGVYGETVGTISAEQISTSCENSATTFLWAAFCGYRKSDSIILLYFEPDGSFMILAKTKFLNETDWYKVHNLVASKLLPN